MAEDTAPAASPQSDKGFSDILKSAGVVSPAEYEKKAQGILAEHKAARQPFVDQSNALMKQYEVLTEKMSKIERPAAPNLEKIPDVPDSQYRDPMQALGNLASVLAIFGSLRTRAPMTAALNSAAAAMEGFHKGDKERVKLEQKKWEDEMTKGLRQNQEEMQKYTAALQAAQFDLEKAQPAFRAIAAQNEHNTFLAAIEQGDYKAQYQILDTMMKTGTKSAELLLKHQEHVDKIREMGQRAAESAQYHRDTLQLRRDQMEQKAEKDAQKSIEANKPTERAIEIIGQMKGIIDTNSGVTGAGGMARRPLESVVTMLGGADSGPAHQYESLARELQNILRQAPAFSVKGKMLKQDVLNQDVLVRGLKFGDTGTISGSQLDHLLNVLTGQGASFESQDGKVSSGQIKTTEKKIFEGTTYTKIDGHWYPDEPDQ